MKAFKTLIICLITTTAIAQTPEADQLLQENQYQEAEDLYSSYLKTYPEDSLVMYKLGMVHTGLKQWDQADQFFQLAVRNNFPLPIVAFQRAQNQLEQDNIKMAMKELTDGSVAGMRNYIRLTQDPVFEPLHSMPEWKSMIEKVELNTYPCLSQQESRHFDFWIGSWDVYVNGRKVGENMITRANGGCAIHESYTTYPRDYTGQSINYYDPLEKRWHQHWVGSAGDITNYFETGKSEGMLEFTGNMIGANGNEITNRMTFTLLENGNVRQLIETSRDNGTTWSSSFDGLYIRQEKP